MKHLLLIILALMLLASLSFGAFHLGFDAGYSYASMDDLKHGLTTIKEDALAAGKDASLQKFGDSVFVNVDLDMGPEDTFSFGPRLGGQFVLPAEITVTDPLDPSTTTKNSYSAALMPIMFGANLKFKIPMTAFLLKAGAYAGYGLAFATQGVNVSANIPGTKALIYDNLYQGGGFMADASGAVEIFLASFLTFDVNFGYRMAKFNNLRSVDEVALGNNVIIPKGHLLIDPSGQDRTADFSGFNAGIGFNLRF
jgi:hypothetical protein